MRVTPVTPLSTLFISVLLWALFAPGALHAQSQQEEVFEDVRAQGVHYYKRGRYKQARKELERARTMRGGTKDVLTLIFLAKSYEGLRRLDLAFPLAEQAVTLTRDDSLLGKRSRGLITALRSSFGVVKVESDVASGQLYLKTGTRFINRAKREHFKSSQQLLGAEDSVFPIRLFLPDGEYQLNGIPFVLNSVDQSVRRLHIPSTVIDQGVTAQTWLYVSGGVAAAVAAGVGAWFLITAEEDVPPPGFSHRVIINSGAP